jgi:regulator of protease activity HflC (stomatin/prohibitin superfamily)
MHSVIESVWRWIDNNLVKVIIGAVTVAILVVVLWPLSVFSIPSGHLGVRWSRFFGGTVTDEIYQEGTHVIPPWDQMTIYDARLQVVERNFDVLTADGLSSTVNVAFRFRLDEKNVGILQKYVGPDYLEVLLAPEVGAQARHVFALYAPTDAFTARRREIERQIRAAVDHNLFVNFNPANMDHVRYIVLEDILIRSVKFPLSVAQAIERKSTESNRAQEYDFTLQAERKEAERKEIEAQGIRRFQDIVKDGLTDSYLRWRGIDATLSLAQSPNSKVVIIGSGPNGLPIILGNDDHAASPGPVSKPTGPITLPSGSAAQALSGPRLKAQPPPASPPQ